jgi:hypothetical protein
VVAGNPERPKRPELRKGRGQGIRKDALAQFGKGQTIVRRARDAWLADSRCTVHIANKQDIFTDYTPLAGKTISGLGDNVVKAHG